MKLKVCILNLWGFNDWQIREPKIVSYLKQQKPDIVFLQEVLYEPSLSPYTQAELLNRQLDYEFISISVPRLFSSEKIKNHREGLAVLSETAILKNETLVLKKEEKDKHTRIVQLLDIQLGDSTISLAHVHFSNRHEWSRLHLQELLELLSARGEERIIIGDFNMLDPQKNTDLYGDKYVISTEIKSYISYPEKSETLDYVLLPRQFEMTNIETSAEGLSDHLAVMADITL